jgi:hypothetical protein
VTVNPSGTGDYFNASLDEFSGGDPTTPLSVDGGGTNVSGTNTPTKSITPATDDELILTVIITDNTHSGDMAQGSGYTLQELDLSGARQPYGTAHKIMSGGSGVSQTVGWYLGAGSTGSVTIYCASFKLAGGAPAGGARRLVGQPFSLAGQGGLAA